MNILKVFLFGKFRVEIDTNMVQKFEPNKAKELLVYLLLNRDQPHAREQLAEVLWKEIGPEQSKSYLRKALWQLQQFLESCASQGMLLVEGEWLQVNPQFNFWLDIETLEKTFKDTQGLRGKDLEEEQASSLQAVVNTYQGDLMEGWYQDWCLYERERLRYMYLALLDKLMDFCEARADYENGLLIGERILKYDRARERTHRRLMRLHSLAGDRTAALRQYHKCVVALKEELDVNPADRTRLLYEMICTDNLETAVPSGPMKQDRSYETDEPLHTLFSHLRSLQKSLGQIQTQIAQDMQVIQRTLKNNRS